MKKYFLRYVMMIYAVLSLFIGCSYDTGEATEDTITLPEITNPVQNEMPDTANLNKDEFDVEDQIDTKPSEPMVIPKVDPTVYVDRESPLEIEVEIKQPWLDDVDNDEDKSATNAESDKVVDVGTGSEEQDSASSENDILSESEKETDEVHNGDEKDENTITNSSDDNKPDFSLEIE